MESELGGVYVCAHSSSLIPFENRKHDLLSVPTSSFFFWATRKGIVVFVGKKKHIHTGFFLDEEKEKARGENSGAKCVVRLHYQFLC